MFEPPAAVVGPGAVGFDPIGGMQNHCAQLTRALGALGVHQVVLTHRPPGAPRRQRLTDSAVVRRFGLPVPWGRQLYSVPAAMAAWRLAPRADLVHVHLGEDLAAGTIAQAVARANAIALVVTVHLSLRHTVTGSGRRAWLLRSVGGRSHTRVCRRADAVIALTPSAAARLGDDGVAADHIHVIPPGVNSAEFSGDPPDPFDGFGHPRVVFVGRLAYQKGPEALIAAAARLRTPGVRVLLVGDGPLRGELERAIVHHRLTGRVRITGFRPHCEIPAILRHADLVCLPSRYEEHSSALLEAMRAGRPIVATRVGGIPEAIGPAGRLVAPGDPDALARALDDLLANPADAARLGRLGDERARGYEWAGLAARTLAVYRDAASSTSAVTQLPTSPSGSQGGEAAAVR